MKPSEIVKMLEETGFPVVYYSYPDAVNLPVPFIVYRIQSYADEDADNVNWTQIGNVEIGLYTKDKDFDSESKLEDVLTAHDLYFDKSESYLENEELFGVLYEVEIVIER